MLPDAALVCWEDQCSAGQLAMDPKYGGCMIPAGSDIFVLKRVAEVCIEFKCSAPAVPCSVIVGCAVLDVNTCSITVLVINQGS